MANLTLSKAVRSNLLHLQNTAKMMDSTQERLATGLKVNSALDNPTNFFTAQSLNSRAADIGTLLDSMSNGIRTIEAADNGLTSITKTIESMQSTLRQARQDKSFKHTFLSMDVNRTGELSFSGGGFPADETRSIALTNAVPSSFTAGADFALTKTQGAASFDFTSAEFDNANDSLSFDLEIDGVTQTVTITKTIADASTTGNDGVIDTVGEMQVALQSAIEASGFAASAFTISEDSGTFTIASTTTGASSSASISSAAATYGGSVPDPITGGTWADYDHDTGGDLSFSVQGNNDASPITVTIDATGVTDSTAITVDEAVTQINEDLAAAGSSIRARANADGDLEFYETDTTNTTGSATITITANDDTAALGLTVDNSTNTVSTGGADTLTISGSGLDSPTDTSTTEQSVAITLGYGTQTIDLTMDGDTHTTPALAVDYINEQIAAHNATAASGDEINVTASVKDGRIVLKGPADGTGPAITVTDTVASSGDTDVVFGTSGQRTVVAPSLASGDPKTVDQLVSEINASADFKNIIRASNDSGRLRIENLSTSTMEISGLTDGKVSGGVGTTEVAGNDIRANLAAQFNELRTALDGFARDASFNGVNLLRGDQLKIVFNETGTSLIEIEAKNAKGEARPIDVSHLGIGELMSADLDLDSSIDDLLANLQGVLEEVRAQSSSLGSTLSVVQNREKFTKEMINTLETGAANLTLADTNEEAANMLALQTRQQLSQTALSLASQADQAVLRLFG